MQNSKFSQSMGHLAQKSGGLQRRWQNKGRSQFVQDENVNYINFMVMSYNILSQKLLLRHKYLYRQSPSEALKWENRCRGILHEIKSSNVDLFCLQEIEEDDYNNVFRHQLLQAGYYGMFKKKTGNSSDGCAIFYRHQRFYCDTCVAVEFKREGNRLLNKDTIGIVGLFRPHGTRGNVKFCVATTHLLFNPKRGDIKLAQLQVLFAEIDQVAFKGISLQNKTEYYPIILCGDFNSMPYSPLYNFITTGNICCQNLLAGDVSGQEEGQNKGSVISAECIDLYSVGITRCSQYEHLIASRTKAIDSKQHYRKPMTSPGSRKSEITARSKSIDRNSTIVTGPNSVTNQNSQGGDYFFHNFRFVSAYKHHASDGSTEVTTCHSKTKCTVDYIFYSSPKSNTYSPYKRYRPNNSLLNVLGVYSLFSANEMDLLGNIPNWAFPSDHMCLIAHFALLAS